MRPSHVIGIDPDITASGWAEVIDGKVSHIACYDLPHLDEQLRQLPHGTLVVIEASWLTTHNWHGIRGSAARAAALGRSVGLNHATGMHIASLAEYHGLNVQLQAPLRKCWKGRDGKITANELRQHFGRYLPEKLPRTNQEERDAILLAIYHSPI